MVKSNQTANEAQLKARRTSLGKKTTDELITIILRKDKSERTMNSKIQELTALLEKSNKLNEEKSTRIMGFEKDIAGMEDAVKLKQEQINNLLLEKHTLEDERNHYCKKVVNLKNVCSLRRRFIFVCFGIIAILFILNVILIVF